MVEGKINLKTGEILCPLCSSEHFTTFRKDELTDRIYLNHCKCESCGQLFVYKTNDGEADIILRKYSVNKGF